MSQSTLPNIKLSLPHSRFKNSLTQLSDFFSEFGPLSPAVNHDRPERSLHMRLYTLDKRNFVLVIMAFFACFSLGIFIGLAGPDITLIKEINAMSLVNSSQDDFLANGPFVIQTQLLGTYSRQLWLFAKYKIESTDNEIFDTSFNVNVIIKGLEDETLVELDEYSTINRTRHLKCKGNHCEEFTIVHLAWLEYSHYQFNVHFYGLTHKRYNINKLTFYIKTFNPAYTSLEISFRLIFLFFAFITLCWFYHTLKKHPITIWSIEQKFTFILLPMLILFNNPLFPLMFLCNSMIVGMIDALFQTTFLCALLLFWVTVYHALRQNLRSFFSFYLPKILILSPIWLCALTLATWEKCSELRDPTWIHFVDGNYGGFKTFFYISVAMYIIYLLFLIFSAYSDLRTMQYFDMRLKFLSLLMIFVMVVTVWTTISRFGGIGIVEDNFVGQLSTTYKSSAHFMCFYGMINFYIITMSYVYSPVSTLNEPVRKDNPAFSMINDSDEEELSPTTLNKQLTDSAPAVLDTESIHVTIESTPKTKDVGSQNGNNKISKPPENISPVMRTVELGTERIQEGFVNGEIIVTLLPVNESFAWITPAVFRPELVPEELMAEGLTLTVEEYVHAMETLVNDYRFTAYNICYKRVLMLWIILAFCVLLGLLFSGITGILLFSLGVAWLFLNATAIFICMWIKLKLARGLEKCLARVNSQLMKHKIVIALDDRGNISCHKINLCFIYFDPTQCINYINSFIERNEQNGAPVNPGWESRLDIEANDIVIQGSSSRRVPRKQNRGEQMVLRYISRWGHEMLRNWLKVTNEEPGRHMVKNLCPCQFIVSHLEYKPKGAGYCFCYPSYTEENNFLYPC
ncbi:CLUMA_CG013243, isoform B [Clunio marinus]|uniref:CLUMA_CG013243, isoform B n=1 Tax=Clunio marinus TaxID=568069 RepID=A0A1J1IN91_9DIPT|nr:CLUMA_CG013243, isoform B [Clunio marinus]